MTKRFVFDLDDERRAKLEAYRARRGLRSFKEALHDLIDRFGAAASVSDEIPAPPANQALKAFVAEVRKARSAPKPPAPQPKPSGEAVSQTVGRSDPLASVPVGPQPFKSRLKVK